MMNKNPDAMTTAQVAARIRVLRGRAVLFASDIAALYGLSEADISSVVESQPDVFPADFITRRPQGEWVFNEQGASMLAALLSNTHRVDVSIAIMRAFVLLRRKHPPAQIEAAAIRTKRHRSAGHTHKGGRRRNRESKI
ncbi:MAG: hypothetical protein JNL39_22355 [Opitutaceae bacterium]|nr:hypothetical protein [Opitutaceae bacterium]